MKEKLGNVGYVVVFLCAAVIAVSCQQATAPLEDPKGGIYHSIQKVFKYDESLFCGTPGISLAQMQTELTDAGVLVHCAMKAVDGVGRLELCDTQTGSINVFTILAVQFNEAELLGFQSVVDLPNYQDTRCEELIPVPTLPAN